MGLRFDILAIQERTFLKKGMAQLAIRNMQRIKLIKESGNLERFYKELDLVVKMRNRSSQAVTKYLIAEGFSYNSTPVETVYKNGSELLQTFIETEDLYQEVLLYLEYECGFVAF